MEKNGNVNAQKHRQKTGNKGSHAHYEAYKIGFLMGTGLLSIPSEFYVRTKSNQKLIIPVRALY